MKKLIFILLILISFSSCDEITKEENPQKETSIQLQKLAEIDSNTYKVVIIKDHLYAINTKTNLIEYKVINNDSLVIITSVLVIIIVVFLVTARNL